MSLVSAHRYRVLCRAAVLLLGILSTRSAFAQEQVEYYGADAIGSARIVFDASGAVTGRMDYGPFGEALTPAGGVGQAVFAQLFRDGEIGLNNAQARMYQPRSGRFNAVDPVYDGLAEPQRWNRYSYVLNNPVALVDPNGLQADSCLSNSAQIGSAERRITVQVHGKWVKCPGGGGGSFGFLPPWSLQGFLDGSSADNHSPKGRPGDDIDPSDTSPPPSPTTPQPGPIEDPHVDPESHDENTKGPYADRLSFGSEWHESNVHKQPSACSWAGSSCTRLGGSGIRCGLNCRLHGWVAMTKFELYRFLAPFRSRLQKRLRNERLNLNFDDFMCAIEKGTECPRVVRSLWDRLREESFVEDFRPDPDDSLHKIYAMGPEEIRDELVAPIVTQLRLEMAQVDFANVTFASFDTPRAVAKFLIGIANRR